MLYEELQKAYPSAKFIQKSKTLILPEDEMFEAAKKAFDLGCHLLLDITVIDYLDYEKQNTIT